MVSEIISQKSSAGHRQRLRERFLAGEADSHSDEVLLELLLTFAIGRKDVQPLAQELIRIFGSLSRVLCASPEELSKVNGVGQSSIVLLKAINFIQSDSVSPETRILHTKRAGNIQKVLLENPPDGKDTALSYPNSKRSDELNKPLVPTKRIIKESMINTATKKNIRRKFQVSNGYLLEFDQLARVMHFLLEHRDLKKISRNILREETGLADRQVESLVSMGAAMGLIIPGRQILTPFGSLIAKHDIFIEKKGTLEWCHYTGAGSFRNLIWFEIFNHYLKEASPMTQEEWDKKFRNDLAGQYSNRTLSKSLRQEVRFIIDAYLERNFSKLQLLYRSSEAQLYLRRYTSFSPLILSAMIYDFCHFRQTELYQINELTVESGSPPVVFGLDVVSFRRQIEGLHDRGWLRYETTHNLDQIRLKSGFSALKFFTAYYEDREPRENIEQSTGELFE